MNFPNQIKGFLAASIAVTLIACGGSSSPPPAPAAPVVPPPPPAVGLAIQGTTRAIANTIYTYQATPTNTTATGGGFSWSASDPAAAITASTTPTGEIRKVWTRPGTYTHTVTAQVGGAAVSTTQTVEVVGEPMATNGNSTCAIRADGRVGCWGLDSSDQLRSNGGSASMSQVVVPGLDQVVALSVGGRTACAVTSNGKVLCWGDNETGKVGQPIQFVQVSQNLPSGAFISTQVPRPITYITNPIEVPGQSDVAAVSVGSTHVCAVKSNGTVMCWGYQANYRLGNGVSTQQVSGPVAVADLTDAVSVSAGNLHTCAVRRNGTVVCWGLNEDPFCPLSNPCLSTPFGYVSPGAIAVFTSRYRGGALGDGTRQQRTGLVNVANLSGAVSVDVGDGSACAVRGDGSVFCWGALRGSDAGPLSFVVAPTVVTDAIATKGHGTQSACALIKNGSLKCWGWDSSQSLPDTSLPIEKFPAATAISRASNVICTLRADGSIACMGNNYQNELGSGINYNVAPEPITLPGLANVTQLNLIYPQGACALDSSKSVFCWGLVNASNSTAGDFGPVPKMQNEDANFSSLITSLNSNSRCAVTSNGITFCWKPDGSILIERYQYSSGISIRGNCNLNSFAFVTCFGANGVGQLGDGTTVDKTISIVPNLLNVKELYTRDSRNYCALRVDGTVVCWGLRYFGLPNLGVPSLTPVAIEGLTDIADLSLGYTHACALKRDGSAVCVGDNIHGQLGDGTTTTKQLPATVLDWYYDMERQAIGSISETGIAQISAGINHTCALLKDGKVVCWGRNDRGQLGLSTRTEYRAVPALAARANNVASVWAAESSTYVIKKDGTVAC